LPKYTRPVKKKSRILVCPLDWGIGHATRCVPLIRLLLQRNLEVVIAADGRPLAFLREYFPRLEFISYPGFRVSYPTGNGMVFKIIKQSPAILSGIYREHRELKKIIRDHKFDAVISDNRFGAWSSKVHSVYMTHQLAIRAPRRLKWAEPLLFRAHRWLIGHYDECWIPDLPGENNLSGDLSHNRSLPENYHFAGMLSRFEGSGKDAAPDLAAPGPELLIMLSGPEPQRTIMEKIMLDELARAEKKDTVILRGLPGPLQSSSPLPGVILYNHLPDKDIRNLICKAGIIICRPGYSTLMDLVTLGRNAILVPTSGQTEQEYLADYLSEDGSFISILQEGFRLDKALEAGRKLTGTVDLRNDPLLLEGLIDLRFTVCDLGSEI
jgi:predicted glycosyltransferase